MVDFILNAAGVRHKQGRFNSPPASTYAVYFDDISADGADRVVLPAGATTPRVYHHTCRIEVYEPKPDPATEAAIEAEFNERGISWTKEDRFWLQDTQRYQVIYEFEYTDK